MQTFFGAPIEAVLMQLAIIWVIIMAVMLVFALRKPVFFKAAWRNISRRRMQTGLIVAGLMLASLLFSASFATGDTLTHSLRLAGLRGIGEIDLMVEAAEENAFGQKVLIDEQVAETAVSRLQNVAEVEGVAGYLSVNLPLFAPQNRRSEPNVVVLGYDVARMVPFDKLETADGEALDLSLLDENSVFVSTAVADELAVEVNDTLEMVVGDSRTEFTVEGVYDSGANPYGGAKSLVTTLPTLQTLMHLPDQISGVLITNQGDALAGADHTETVTARLNEVALGSDLVINQIKDETLAEAEEAGSGFTSIFLLFGQFAIASGILLIFLIFVMLASERQKELGITRAVGVQRRHVIQMFVYEGTLYAMFASAVGSVLGVIVGISMVQVMARAFGQATSELQLTYKFNWQSVAIAYLLGVVFTTIIVSLASWRVSRINIVQAIRGIPEAKTKRRTWKGVAGAVLLIFLGVYFGGGGYIERMISIFMLGASLVIIGLSLLAVNLRLPSRLAYSFGGLALLAWWMLPGSVTQQFLPDDMTQGIEIFFISGIMIVIGAVWVVIYNADIIFRILSLLFGRVQRLTPILKMAIAYPLQNSFRTGMALAMISLVVFTLAVMAVLVTSQNGILDDTPRLSGGFDMIVSTNPLTPLSAAEAQFDDMDGFTAEAVTVVGGYATWPFAVKQAGTAEPAVDLPVYGFDTAYTDHITYDLAVFDEAYDSPRAVWQALQNEENVAIVSYLIVPSLAGNSTSLNAAEMPITLEGMYREDETLPEISLTVVNQAGEETNLRVIGMLDPTNVFAEGLVLTSQETLSHIAGVDIPTQHFALQLAEGVTAVDFSVALEETYYESGLQARVLANEIRTAVSSNTTLNNLLQGFMGLGLVVGIAALGVLSARSVVERRQQIGMLRALGYQKQMVALSFLFESSFVATLGIGLGVVLGLSLSYNIVQEMAESSQGVVYTVPWVNLILITVAALGASLLTTFLAARQAAAIEPAEALRYD